MLCVPYPTIGAHRSRLQWDSMNDCRHPSLSCPRHSSNIAHMPHITRPHSRQPSRCIAYIPLSSYACTLHPAPWTLQNHTPSDLATSRSPRHTPPPGAASQPWGVGIHQSPVAASSRPSGAPGHYIQSHTVPTRLITRWSRERPLNQSSNAAGPPTAGPVWTARVQ